jgi:putative ABC transport system substrate-binding protein
MQATQTIPVVIVGVRDRDPVGAKLIANLARPGGNVTGISGPEYADLDGKRVELIKAVVPGLTRVAVLQNLGRWAYSDAANAEYRQNLDRAARVLGCSLIMFALADSDDFEAFFGRMVKAGVGALLVPGDPFVNAHGKRLIDLPDIGFRPSMARIRSAEKVASCGMERTPSQLFVDRWTVVQAMRRAKKYRLVGHP